MELRSGSAVWGMSHLSPGDLDIPRDPTPQQTCSTKLDDHLTSLHTSHKISPSSITADRPYSKFLPLKEHQVWPPALCSKFCEQQGLHPNKRKSWTESLHTLSPMMGLDQLICIIVLLRGQHRPLPELHKLPQQRQGLGGKLMRRLHRRRVRCR